MTYRRVVTGTRSRLTSRPRSGGASWTAPAPRHGGRRSAHLFLQRVGRNVPSEEVVLVYLQVDEIDSPPCCSGPRWRLARSQTEVCYGSTCSSSGPAFAEGIRVMKACFVAVDAKPPTGDWRSSVTHETPAF